jgi:putative oxidoreductase
VPGMKRAFRLIPALEWPMRPVLGIGLGLAFFYAGVQKYLAPYEFAEAILAYQLLTKVLVGLTAAIFPPLELAVGGFLILGYLAEAWGRLSRRRTAEITLSSGIFRRASLLLILLQLVIFILVLLITMARGLKIDCGCGLFMDRQVGFGAIVEDLFLLGLTAWLYWMESKVVPESKAVFESVIPGGMKT